MNNNGLGSEKRDDSAGLDHIFGWPARRHVGRNRAWRQSPGMTRIEGKRAAGGQLGVGGKRESRAGEASRVMGGRRQKGDDEGRSTSGRKQRPCEPPSESRGGHAGGDSDSAHRVE
ncbi:hypothetical protein NL676_034829 [Syzygium grande]|nr:hypothetical protein NL676_034829 [Syzygium grande]